MPIVRGSRADIDDAKLLADLAARRQPSEEEIEAQAREEGDAWTDAELVDAQLSYPPPSPERLRAPPGMTLIAPAGARSSGRCRTGSVIEHDLAGQRGYD
jgi:hypothetical protein